MDDAISGRAFPARRETDFRRQRRKAPNRLRAVFVPLPVYTAGGRGSCVVLSPIRDARFVDLILAVFMCNSGRRQERVCRTQRPAAKIVAIATSAGGRDRTSAFERAEMPANCGLFVRDQETSVRIGLCGGARRT